jgi:lipoprotein-anchoring transpeptidase ErfK/SrfK
MNDDQIERRLREAFDARARAALGDSVPPPAPRFATSAPRRHRRARLLAPLAAAAAVLAVVGTVLGLEQGSGHPSVAAGHSSAAGTSSTAPSSPASTAPAAPTALVHVSGYPDHTTVGVGMPIIATFARKITDARAFVRGTTVTVNGKPADGAWYFEYSDPSSGHAMEAHYRLPTYWPAHAKIAVRFRLGGVSAGKGLAFDGKLTSLEFATGAAHVALVNDATHRMTVTSDGKTWAQFPVSLGAPQTPTKRGTKIVMEKGLDVAMRGPGYYDPHVKYTQRLTYGGEYLHAAQWNTFNIEHGIDSSNGCTNLLPADAARLYKFLEIGDVVEYPNASGSQMTMGDGYGDWNISWSQWLTGGVLATH